MAMIIKGFSGGENINMLNKRESIGIYAGILAKYFQHTGNSMVDVDLHAYTNLMLIYSKVRKMTTCGECPGGCKAYPDIWNLGRSDAVWEHMHLQQETPEFMRVEVDRFTHRLCDGSIVISLTGVDYNRVIGEYCPKRKILLASDWTNDDSKIEFVSTILSNMEGDGLLTKRTYEKIKPNIMLGADPELELVDADTNEILNCRAAGIRDRVLYVNAKENKTEGRIGVDGAGAPRELRPEPSPTPEGLVANIDKLVIQALDEIWCLVGDKYAIGGHIHLGGVHESREFGKLLDYYLGPLSTLNGIARINSQYGKIGSSDNIRKQPHGIEFRTPPAAWLASRELALITLTIVKLAAEKHYCGEDITLSNIVKDDLVALGLTIEQAEKFFSEISRFKANGLPRDMKVAWGYKNPPKFILEFRDGWSENVKDYIETLMKEIAISENLGGRCVFYGLAEDRGNVFSVIMSNMNGIDMPETYGFMPPMKSGVGKNYVGMPASIRNDLGEAKKMTATIVEVIKRTIKPPVKKIQADVPPTCGDINVSGAIPSMRARRNRAMVLE